MEPRYLVVEGPIGVGKTSLVSLLADERGGRAVLEETENNPFLFRFYRDRRRWAFQTQLFFLLSRYRQQEDLAQQDLFSSATITDAFLPKDRIFASLNLSPDELVLYDQVYGLLPPRLPHPDLVIYLHAETDVLMQRGWGRSPPRLRCAAGRSPPGARGGRSGSCRRWVHSTTAMRA